MHMYLYNIIISHYHQGIADRHQIVLKLFLIFLCEFFFQHDDEFRTVSEFNITLFCRHRLCSCNPCCRLFKVQIDLLAKIAVKSAFQDFHKSLSSGIYHTCFFQHRQKFRCSGKNSLSLRDHICKETFQAFTVLCNLRRFIRHPFCHSKDGSFFWFHNCFISSLHCSFKGSGKSRRIDFITFFYNLCKSS